MSEHVENIAGEGGAETYISYHDNQTVAVKTTVLHDQPHGEMLIYDDKGALLQKSYYQHGLLHGEVVIYQEGKIFSITPFVDGKKHGLAQVFDNQGKLSVSQCYEADQLHGKSIWYSPEQTVVKLANYRFNQLQGKTMLFYANGKSFEKHYYHGGVPCGNIIRYTPTGAVETISSTQEQ